MGAFGSFFPIVFIIVSAIVIGLFILILGGSAMRGLKNNASPRLTTPAYIVGRREDCHRHGGTMAFWTRYYVTFEVSSGDRMELEVNGSQYGQLAEGDRGELTFQGTRFISFERDSW